MNLEKLFKGINIDSINEYIENAIQEDYYLEFKTANYPNKNGLDSDNKNFSKMISSFANSNGGIIVWGIDARKNEQGVDAAKSKKAIQNVKAFESHLKRVEGTVVTPQIEGIKYKNIIEESSNGYLVVYVPRSENAPHMASDKHYYKRSGDSNYMCEHYDIVDILNRKTKPSLILKLSEVKKVFGGSKMSREFYRIESIIQIVNNGKATAKFLKLNINYNSYSVKSEYGIDGNRTTGLKIKPTSKPYEFEYNGGLEIVLHPNEKIELDKIILNNLYKGETSQQVNITYSISAEDFPIKKGKLIISPIEI